MNINKIKMIGSIILIISIYLLIIFKTDFNDFLSYYANNRLNVNDNDIKNRVAYNSLNRIISFNDTFIESKDIIVSKIIEEKNEVINEPIVYIYNSHDSEKYSRDFVSNYSVVPSVKYTSFILQDALNSYNIGSYVETNSVASYIIKNKMQYNESYDVSRKYLLSTKKKYNFKYYIDIHRDSSKKKYTLFENGNKKYARVLFVVGMKHKNSNENLKFVNTLNDLINKKYKGLSRGILKRDDARFNQDVSSHAILLEVGGVDNTLEEINNTMEAIAYILNEYMSDNNG